MDDEPTVEGFRPLTDEEEREFSLSEESAAELKFVFRELDEAQGAALAQARTAFVG